MKVILLTAFSISVFCVSAFSQIKDSDCPTKFSIAPESVINQSETGKFGVTPSGNTAKNKPKYEWTVSAGQIIGGQNTPQIAFFASPEITHPNVTISVKIDDGARQCSVSETFVINLIDMNCGLGDQFGKINTDEYRARLDSFFTEIIINPGSEGVIKLDFDKNDDRQYRISLLNTIVKHIKFREFDPKRVTIGLNENVDADEENTRLDVFAAGYDFSDLYENYTLIQAEELEQKINELFSKK